MNCEDFGEKYLLRRFDELDESEVKAFDAHLEECETCRNRYEQVLLIMDSYKDLDNLVLDDEATKRIEERLVAVIGSKQATRLTIIGLPMKVVFRMAASVIVLLGLLVIVMSLTSPGGPDATARTSDTITRGVAELPEEDEDSATAIVYSDWVAGSLESGQRIITDGEEPGLIELQIEELDRILADNRNY